ncbi:hypothetical protein FJ251_16135 [bacterium]|nr:hypothetical protein [bacterium]
MALRQACDPEDLDAESAPSGPAQYCPRFGGLFTAFALLPDSVSCGPEEAWRLTEAPPALEDYGEGIAPTQAAVPRDVPIPRGFRRIKV